MDGGAVTDLAARAAVGDLAGDLDAGAAEVLEPALERVSERSHGGPLGTGFSVDVFGFDARVEGPCKAAAPDVVLAVGVGVGASAGAGEGAGCSTDGMGAAELVEVEADEDACAAAAASVAFCSRCSARPRERLACATGSATTGLRLPHLSGC